MILLLLTYLHLQMCLIIIETRIVRIIAKAAINHHISPHTVLIINVKILLHKLFERVSIVALIRLS